MQSLKDAYKDYFKIGAAISTPTYRDSKELIIEQYNTITCENEMKYLGVCNDREEYDFTKADELYNFARENGIEVRGHNLVWHQSVPTEHLMTFSPEALWERIKEHITKVTARYPDVSCWDVINEAIDDKHGLYLRDTVWKEKFGEDYCRKIYSMVREIIPSTPLVYNDYNEFIPEKREKMLRLVKELKSEGLVDAVGFQCHITVYDVFSLDELKRTFEAYAGLGLRIHVTELDISLPGIDTNRTVDEATPEEIERQAALYGDVFKIFREYHELIDSVTMWGIADDVGWLNFCFGGLKRNGLLFDRNRQPNECYRRVVEF